MTIPPPWMTRRLGGGPAAGAVTLSIEVRGAKSIAKLAARLSEIEGVVSVNASDANLTSE
jgi:hypothetical protein